MYIDIVPLNESSFLYTMKSETAKAMREWENNHGVAIWCSPPKEIPNERCMEAVFMDLDPGKCSAMFGKMFPAALQRISRKTGAAA